MSTFRCYQKTRTAENDQEKFRGSWGWSWRALQNSLYNPLHRGCPWEHLLHTAWFEAACHIDGPAGFRTSWSWWVGAQDLFVTGFVSKAENVLIGFALRVCTGCPFQWSTHRNWETRRVFPSLSLPRRGEGGGSAHCEVLPVHSCWKRKRVFILNLAVFYKFYHQAKWKWYF